MLKIKNKIDQTNFLSFSTHQNIDIVSVGTSTT